MYGAAQDPYLGGVEFDVIETSSPTNFSWSLCISTQVLKSFTPTQMNQVGFKGIKI